MNRRLDARFAAQAELTPNSVALRRGSRSITYAALEARAARVAGALTERGIGPGAVVGLHLERSIDQVSAMLGILASGAAVMPLPPSFPEGRKRDILQLAESPLVIGAGASTLSGAITEGVGGCRVLTIEELLDGGGNGVPGTAGAKEARSFATFPDADPEQLAFVLSSSGSTGVPKLIGRSHRSFFHRLEWTWKNHPYADGEVCCQKAYMTTTHSIYELFEPLLAGVETVIVPDEEVRDLERFWEVVRERGVSRLLIVPSPLRASLSMKSFDPPPLRVMVIMGEYVHPRLAAETIERFPTDTSIYSIYGSTEASSTLVCDLRALYRDGQELPLGEPISGDTRALVLDEDRRPVRPGERGRLYIGGPALFGGYVGDPEATAAVLITERDTGATLYDTRDEVELTESSELVYVGRADHTVKVRGFRVNTREVESAARTHPGVAAAAVVTDRGPGGDATLVAFVTPSNVDREAVYATMRSRLPDYMVPAFVVPVDAFPMTSSAKIDRVRLLEKHRRRRESEAGSLAAAQGTLTEVEGRVSEIWAGTLGHRAFGLDSSWFEVGGSSLTVFAMVHRLRESTGLGRDQLNEQTVYVRPTIRELASWIEDPEAPSGAAPAGEAPILVRLRSGSPEREPLFVVASAGGTLGAYAKLTKVLHTDREILGVRDPLIWGGREGNEGFRAWCERYVAAIRLRQPDGPYYICAYSSAGAFGFEIARRLREDGQEVALLALVEPLALDRATKRRFGHWALRSTWMRPSFRELVRAAGRIRTPVVRILERLRSEPPVNDHRFPAAEFEALSRELTTKREHLVNLSRLMELNSDQPFALDENAGGDPGGADWMDLLKRRVAELTPEVDLESIERIAVQYQLQVRTHHAYRLSAYDGPVLLVEPQSRYSGILAELIRPYVRRLESFEFALGPPTERVRELVSSFGGLTAHYRCMRDEGFVRELAAELDRRLA